MTLAFSRRRFLQSAGALAGCLATRSLPAFAADAIPTPASLQTPYKYGKLVLSASREASAFDSKSVDCPFVFQHAGRFHMTYVGFDGTGYQTGLASSENLVDWKKLGCILRRDPRSEITRYNIAMNWILRENEVRSPGALRKVRGRFLGAYHAYPNAGYENGPAVIGLCWSRDLFHWHLDPPCLHSDDPSAAPWESGGLYKPCLVEYDGLYYLFYNAKTKNLPKSEGGGWHEQTGVATSKDLKHWVRYQENPIIHNGPKGAWDDRFASDPCVVRYPKGWAFFYYGLSSSDGKARDLLAVGSDPFHPGKTNSILIDAGLPGSVDEDYAHKPSVVTSKGDLYHFYCAVSGKWPAEVRGISVARSRPWG